MKPRHFHSVGFIVTYSNSENKPKISLILGHGHKSLQLSRDLKSGYCYSAACQNCIYSRMCSSSNRFSCNPFLSYACCHEFMSHRFGKSDNITWHFLDKVYYLFLRYLQRLELVRWCGISLPSPECLSENEKKHGKLRILLLLGATYNMKYA